MATGSLVVTIRNRNFHYFMTIIIFATMLYADISATISQDSNQFVGTIRHCFQQESYANNLVRQFEYRQFDAQDGSISDTYGIETYSGIQVAIRMLIDYERESVFYQKGDVQYFYKLDDLIVNTTCLASLHDELQVNERINTLISVTSAVDVVATDFEINKIDYPTQLLLAPSYVGAFPVLADAPLQPFDGRGFSQSIGFNELPSTFIPQDGRLSLELLDQLASFYIDQLSGWVIAPIEMTNFPNNPELMPGDRQAYLTLFNPETEATVDLFFNVPRNQEQLEVVVSVPQSAVETRSESVIEGSSQSLATLDNFFAGWDNPQPSSTYLDGRVEAYALQRGDEYWFVDLEIENGTFEVLFSEVVTQSEFDAEEFLPEWARSP